MRNYDTLVEAINDLKKRGYNKDFNLKSDRIECSDMSLQCMHNEFEIDEFHRFEGNSNPGDNSILYALTSNTGVKGVLLDAYGAYSESISQELLDKLKFKHK